MGMAALFNDSNVDDLDSYEWIIADTSHEKFGEIINEQLLEEGTTWEIQESLFSNSRKSMCDVLQRVPRAS